MHFRSCCRYPLVWVPREALAAARRSEDELRAVFGRFGPILRLVLPHTHTLALIEFAEPQDARLAFKVRCEGASDRGGRE